MNISEILYGLRIGTEKSFNYIFYSYYDRLVLYVDNLLRIKGAADDIVSETFIKFWNSRDAHIFETEKDVESFLYVTAKNGCLNYIRHRQLHQNHLKHYGNTLHHFIGESYAVDLEKQEIIDDLMECISKEIDKLPEKCALVVRLSCIYDMPMAQIVEILDMPAETVSNKRKYGMRMLRKRLRTIGLCKYLNIQS